MTLRNRLNDRPIEVSYTAHKRFMVCPLQEGLLRAGVPRVVKQRRNFLVGNVLHDMLGGILLDKPTPTPMEVSQVFNAEARKPGVYWKGPNDRATLLEKAITVTTMIYPWAAQLMAQATDFSMEYELAAPVPMDPRYPDGESFVMTAKLDLVIAYTTGDAKSPKRYAVIDFKSGGYDKHQLHWYEAVWRRATPGNEDMTSYFVTADLVSGKVKPVRVDATSEQLEEVVADASMVARALAAKELPSKPDSYQCKVCRVRSVCPDSLYRVARGRTLSSARSSS